jgi:quinol monooxygenase YgiN
VDVVPQFKDDARGGARAPRSRGRGHRGNLGFQVWRQTNRSNHFTVVEDWAGRSEFEAHTAAAETREFRTALAEMTGALYDERLYSDLR